MLMTINAEKYADYVVLEKKMFSCIDSGGAGIPMWMKCG